MRKLSGSVCLENTEQCIYHSDVMGKTYKLLIASTSDINKSEKYPVLYLLDANSTFLMAIEMMRLLSYTNEIPPLLVVGIGYEESELPQVADRRLQEFTPTSDPDYKNIISNKLELICDGGDADLFLRFIKDELKPLIQRHYPVDSDDSTFAGDSLGGLFGLFTLFRQHNIFSRYVIGSPIIFWDHGVIWDYEQQYAGDNTDIDAKVFIGIGGDEDRKPYHLPDGFQNQPEQLSFIDDTEKMVKTLFLRKYPRLELFYHLFAGETHMSVIAPWLNRGLRTVFQDITGKQVSSPYSLETRD